PDPNQTATAYRTHSLVCLEPAAQLFQHHSPGQAAAGNLQPRFQLVKMPEEAVLNSSSLSNQVFPVVDQELELAAFAFQPGHRKIRLPERNPRHCHSIDWIRLAQLPARAPCCHH